jgi:tetratricopeptide (TPR) repeat protein
MRYLIPTFALLALGCGARPVGPKPAPPPEVELEMEAVLVEAEAGGSIAVFDAEGLFNDGKAAFERQDFEACEAHYAKLLDRFPTSKYAFYALYNRGLCLEELRLYGQAAAHFRRHAQLATELGDRRDGEFRMGANLVRTKNYSEALHLYDRLLGGDDLEPADRAECHLRRAIARSHLKQPGRADRDLRAAESYIRQAYSPHLQGNDLLAEVHFHRGDIYQRLSQNVPLTLPLKKMKGNLADKVRFFRQAQASFIDALNVRNSYWATASGLRLGTLYEGFYRDVLSADVPADFDKQTRAYYLYELRKELLPLLEQSLAIYEKNITMSERIGARNEWVDETESRVAKLRSLIEASHRAKEPSVEPTEDPPAG